MILCTILSSLLLAFIPAIKHPMQFLGAGYFLYLAWDSLRSHSSLDRDGQKRYARHTRMAERPGPTSFRRTSSARANICSGLCMPKIPLHGLRHTSATLSISLSVEIITVAHRLGHSETSTTLNPFANSLKAKDKEAVNVLGGLFAREA